MNIGGSLLSLSATYFHHDPALGGGVICTVYTHPQAAEGLVAGQSFTYVNVRTRLPSYQVTLSDATITSLASTSSIVGSPLVAICFKARRCGVSRAGLELKPFPRMWISNA